MIPKSFPRRQEKISNGLSIAVRLVAPISESDDLLLAASARFIRTHLSPDCARQKERLSVLNAPDTGGERRKTLDMTPYGEVGWVRNARAAKQRTLPQSEI
jgi:hypothetical protein